MSEQVLNKKQLFEALEQVATQNLLSLPEVYTIIEDAVKKAFSTKFDPDANLELVMNKDAERFELINHSKLVVEDEGFDPQYRAIEVPLSEARKLNPSVQEGDMISEEVDFALYSKLIAQQIRQMFTQTVKEKKKEAVFAKHQSLKGEMIDVTVTTITPNFVIFVLADGTPAFMPAKMRNANVKLSIGQKTKVFVEDVLKDSKDAQILVSNGSKDVVKRVFEDTVPEIKDGTIEIVSISRVPGVRAKVAVKPVNQNVDAVGAVIGSQGTRINSIVEKLDGEKIDVILWSADDNVYVANSLAPARIASVIDKLDANGEVIRGHKIAIVPNKHQTLAIGKQGSNAKLAVELTNIRIDVMSIDDARAAGINFTFNVGLTPAEVEMIENGEKPRKSFGGPRPERTNNFRNNNSNGNFSHHQSNTAIDLSSLNESIENFTTDMVDTKSSSEAFDIDEDLFSEEQLKAMEADFEFDEELEEIENNSEDDEF